MALEVEYEKILREPYDYICQVKSTGKEIRVKLIEAFNDWLKVPTALKTEIQEITEMLHNSSIIIDDIEDNSFLRRGVPGQLMVLHKGQGKDIYWRDYYVCPTEDEYKTMVKQKTGGLFQLAVDLMQLFSENKSDFNPLLEVLALYFQIRDDYANLVSTDYTENKSFCEDLTEGKFSFPIIHGIRNDSSSKLTNILRQRTTDVDVKKYFLQCLKETGTFSYTVEVLNCLEKKALEEIKKQGGNTILEHIIHELSSLYKTVPLTTKNVMVASHDDYFD